MQQNFQYYQQLWRQRFPRRRKLVWCGTWLQNGYCRDCRYCCGPQDNPEPFPMAILPRQMRTDLDKDFYLLADNMAYLDGRGCKSCASCGCRLTREDRPVTCGLFPLVLATDTLYLYKTCPAVLFIPFVEWLDIGRMAGAWLKTFSEAELYHISLNLPAQKLAESYISMEIPVRSACKVVEE